MSFKTRIETKALHERLLRAVAGETVTYAELASLVGANTVQSGLAAGWLASARNMALRDGFVFDVIMNVGLLCADDEKKVALAMAKGLPKIRRAARRVGRRTAAVRDFKELPEQRKLEHNAINTITSLIGWQTRRSSFKRVENKVDPEVAARLSMKGAIESFGFLHSRRKAG